MVAASRWQQEESLKGDASGGTLTLAADGGTSPIMVVSDDRRLREVVAATLERQGYSVVAYPRGAQAVVAAQALPPELVLLELELPDADGLELCDRLRALDGLAELPVVFLGADDDTQGRSRVFSAAGVDFLPTPFGERELLMRVRSHVQLHRLRQWLDARGLDLGQVVRDMRARRSPADGEGVRADARLAMLFSTLPDMAFLKSPEGRYLAINPRVEELFGKPAEAVVGRPDEDVFPAEFAAQVRANDRYAIELGGPYPHEEWVRYPDGRAVLLETIKTPMYDIDGSLLGVLGIARDITEREKDRRRLARSEAALARAQQVAGVGSWAFDPVTCVLEPSAQTIRMYGLDDAGDARSTNGVLFESLHPEDRDWVVAAWSRAAELGSLQIEHRIVLDGETRWVRVRGEREHEDGAGSRLVGTALDITREKEHAALLAAEKAQLEDTLDAANAAGWWWHVPSDEVEADDRWQAMIADLAGREEPLTAAEWLSWLHPDDAPGVGRALSRLLAGETERYEAEYRVRNREGRWAFVRDRGRVMGWTPSGAPELVRGMVLETSTEHVRPEELDFLTQHDGLTGLPTRERFAERVRERMTASDGLVLAILDLDGFHATNEWYGHGAGNAVLVELARRLRCLVDDPADVARLGGDEFAVVFPLDSLDDHLHGCVERLKGTVAEPIAVTGRSLAVSASIGVTVHPQPREVDAEHLLRQADQAAYHAKVAGKDRYHVFDLADDEDSRARYSCLEEVRAGLEAHEFVLHYQPQVDLATGELQGFESLARWQHPERGLLAPAAFVPWLEGDPLAVDFGDWVIGEALEQLAVWNRQGLETVVSVNVDTTQLHDPGFVERLEGHLAARPEVRAEQLVVEILETGVLADLEHVAEVVARLDGLGVQTALDDFGTGYSSLTLLKRLRAHYLKIDRSFVIDLLVDPEHALIISSIIGLASSFGCVVIAEGIETDLHGELLRELGCGAGQGFGIAKPMPAAAVAAWRADWSPPASWREAESLPSERLPELHAAFEHHAWLHALTAHVKGAGEPAPPLDAGSCGLTQWLAEAAGELPSVAAEHEAVHAAARELLGTVTDGGADATLDAVHGRSEAVLAALRERRRAASGSVFR